MITPVETGRAAGSPDRACDVYIDGVTSGSANGRNGTSVIIVGAGPVGLLLANLLGIRGVATTVLEATGPDRHHKQTGSRAIGVTPPSLDILDRVGLAHQAIQSGVSIRRALVHGSPRRRESRPLGELTFRGVHHRFPFILSIPQYVTEAILLDGAGRFPSVTFLYGREARQYREEKGEAIVKCADGSEFRGDYCVACDGAHGSIAAAAGIDRHHGSYNHHFLMGDFVDRSTLGDDAHLWFTRSGAVESFPLPGRYRRWIVQVPDATLVPDELPDGYVEKTVEERTGHTLFGNDRRWKSSFRPSWSRARSFVRGRLFLAGDAAHTMSPIGGQGMNTGFADAAHIAEILTEPPGAAAADYDRRRRRAAAIATRRAAAGMTTGTIRGGVASALRNILVMTVLRSPVSRPVARHFAMTSGVSCGSGKYGQNHP